jgi:hypothetical protein
VSPKVPHREPAPDGEPSRQSIAREIGGAAVLVGMLRETSR